MWAVAVAPNEEREEDWRSWRRHLLKAWTVLGAHPAQGRIPEVDS